MVICDLAQIFSAAFRSGPAAQSTGSLASGCERDLLEHLGYPGDHRGGFVVRKLSSGTNS